ncbi:MAG: hypothetical protein HVN34_03840 [Methanobacteriaceae archaeon]|jgi:hypothetical protein|nr:hypothetical protein [Methanobacteriaceae archaeon]
MKVSEGAPRGRFVELDYINKKQALMEIGGDWKLLAYWPEIMEYVRLLM